MSKLTLRILDKAEEDMTLIGSYIAQDNFNAAINLLKQFYATFETLSEYPNLGYKRPDFTYRDVRFYVVRKNYLILYKVEQSTLFILRVFPSYQDICSLL